MNTSKRNPDLTPEGVATFPLVDEFNSIAKLLVSSGNQFIELQSELTSIAVAELSLRYREMLTIRQDVPALMQWPLYSQAGAQRSTELVRTCWEIATRTQGAMLTAMRECMPQRSAVAIWRSWPGNTFTERRVKATVLKFPDRRRSA